MDVNQLIKLCKENDRVAQKQLYHFLSDDLMRVSRRYAIDMPEAKDVVQNAFIRIFTSIEKFDPKKGSIQGWSKTITVREAIGIQRKKKTWKELDNSIVELKVGSLNEGTHLLNERDTIDAINKLPLNHRTVLLLFFKDEYSYEEIAEMLDMKTSSIRSAVSRARVKFINQWKNANSI